jgi:hypothetical protein
MIEKVQKPSNSVSIKLYFVSLLLLSLYLVVKVYEAFRQVQNIYIYIGPICTHTSYIDVHCNRHPIYKQETG